MPYALLLQARMVPKCRSIQSMFIYSQHQVVPVLLNRFREREETVKGEVFATFVSLLQQVRLLNC
jgi:hypothetical protein